MKERINKGVAWSKAEMQRRRHFIIYSIIGVCGISVDFGIFLLLFNVVGLNEQVANIISTVIAITNNFIWNAFLNFRKTDKLLQRYFTFLSVGMVGLAMTAVILLIFVSGLGINANVVKAGSIVLVVIVQFNLNKRFSFKEF